LIGPFDSYCDGYGNSGASGNSYVCVPNIGTGVIPHHEDLEFGICSIIAYDVAEAGHQSDSAYVGQINMIQASSFCGLNGLVWGYDIARNPLLDSQKPLFFVQNEADLVPVFSMDPLFDSAKALFGIKDQRVFPMLPGAHVICAFKEYTSSEEDLMHDHYFWCALALGIAADRTTMADCFMEGKGKSLVSSIPDTQAWANRLMRNIANSYAHVGEAQNVIFKEIFVGLKFCLVPTSHHGCALVSAPYIVLPKKAIPKNGIEILLDIDLGTWIHECGGAGDNPMAQKYPKLGFDNYH